MNAWVPQRIAFDRDDGLPKYVAISRALALAITEQELQPGDALPSQKELAESFGVTIMTVRQALQTLAEQGLVKSHHGRGTFVATQPYRLAMGPLASFASQIRAAGRSLRTQVLASGPVEVSPMEQKRMDLEGPDAFEIVRLRVVDGQPLVLQCSLLPCDVAERLDVERLSGQSLYAMLWQAGVQVCRATETVQAVDLDVESARALEREAGQPALLSARLSFSSDGRPVIDDRALTAGEAVVIHTERQVGEQGIELLPADQSPLHNPTAPFLRRAAGAR